MWCHYVYEKDGRFLIPGCMAVAVSGSVEDCTCRKGMPSESDQKQIRELTAIVAELHKENARLNRIIKNIYSKQEPVKQANKTQSVKQRVKQPDIIKRIWPKA